MYNNIWKVFDYPNTNVVTKIITHSGTSTYGLFENSASTSTEYYSDYFTFKDSTTSCFILKNSWEICWREKSKAPADRLREIMVARQAPFIHTRSRCLNINVNDEREIRARETLRSVVGEEKYKNFLLNGFISVRNPKSGKNYQIFPGHGMTCVYKNGKMIERLCVVLKGNFPPTDSLIMRYLIILNNEEQFRKLSIPHSVYQHKVNKSTKVKNRPLTEIFRDLKVA